MPSLIFIDDSGDPGFKFNKGSSKIFVIALVIFDDPLDAEEIALKIKRFRQSLGLSSHFEFKSNKASIRLRTEFLNTIKNCNFRIQAIIVQKQKLAEKERINLYRHAIMLVLKHSQRIKNAKIRLDGQGPKRFRQEFTNYLRRALNKPGDAVFKNLRFENSKNNLLIQLADMVAGTLYHDFSHKQDAELCRKIIQNKEEKIMIF